ncbi:hypothetical protein JCGZ_21027 [Jatropha curcas]|uniref:Uncharacterized protein n=1 Tax=Jatropha curcas TaxID=180498 RepID=A0A067K537_JATCU|nr:hypothetical protein JCGZ_21027 [Jatropha curcas]
MNISTRCLKMEEELAAVRDASDGIILDIVNVSDIMGFQNIQIPNIMEQITEPNEEIEERGDSVHEKESMQVESSPIITTEAITYWSRKQSDIIKTLRHLWLLLIIWM